jgi:hypothetical protein
MSGAGRPKLANRSLRATEIETELEKLVLCHS